MKRSISLFLACLTALLLLVPVSAAGEGEDPCVSGHTTVIDEAVAPTCTKPGKTEGSHCSVCGEVFASQETVKATGHNIVTDDAVEPTCTQEGKTEGSHCADCGLKIVPQRTIRALGHKTVIDEFVDSTCTQEGKTIGSHCSVCGEIISPQNTILKKEHSYEAVVIKKSCTADGYTLHTCKTCGGEYRDEFDYAIGHQVVSDGKAVEQTCTTDGITAKTYCSVCLKVIDEPEVLKAKGHQWKTTLTKATAKKDGRSHKACTVCGLTAEGGDIKIAKIASIKLSKTTYSYDGKAKKPTVVVVDSSGKTLTAKKDYTVSYDSGRKKVGTYYVSINFKGNYSGRKVLKFKIVLAKPNGIKAVAGGKAATISWNKVKGAKKYVVYYSTTKNGEYKKAGTTTKLNFTVGNLQSYKTYYFKVRAVTKAIDGSNSYGYYSARTKVQVK